LRAGLTIWPVSKSSAFSVVALVAAYNEADIIHHVVADLIGQGIGVYFLDDGSTDDTVRIVEPFVGRGVLAIEPLPARPVSSDAFDWERILRRKSALAAELDADWFIHHDADEFRESPWLHLQLRDAIHHVDALGFNAIDFAGLDFWPVHDRFRPGDDVREALTCYSEFASYDRLQIRCWKKTGYSVDLSSSGGHEVKFPDRRVFPLPFLLRHYPIRGQEHGQRKVFRERRNRFLPGERARGWHVQYDDVREGASFLRDATALTPYDADAVRVALAVRRPGAESLEAELGSARADIERLRGEVEAFQRELGRTRADLNAKTVDGEAVRAALEHHQAALSEARAEIDSQSAYIQTLTRALEQKAADIERWRVTVDHLTHRLNEMYRSVSWRWTEPARTVVRALRGR
jgi:uncharacterized coiled-coil protein SlyX